MSLNIENNKYCCSRCGAGGFSIGLYAKVKGINTKQAYKELLEREFFSMDKSNITISPINEIADIDKRDNVYREFLSMLKLEQTHKHCLQEQGFLNSTIEEQLYKTVPKKDIKRRLVAKRLSNMYDLSGIPGFYQQEDWKWTFSKANGIYVPCFDEQNRIQSLSVHLDKPLQDGTTDYWFSSKGKINGTSTRNVISKTTIAENENLLVLTDNILLGNLIRERLDVPLIAFSNIVNSYQVLKAVEETNVEKIFFTLRLKDNKNLDYIIHRVYKDLIPLGYDIETKVVRDYTDILDDDFLSIYKLEKVA